MWWRREGEKESGVEEVGKRYGANGGDIVLWKGIGRVGRVGFVLKKKGTSLKESLGDVSQHQRNIKAVKKKKSSRHQVEFCKCHRSWTRNFRFSSFPSAPILQFLFCCSRQLPGASRRSSIYSSTSPSSSSCRCSWANSYI